MNRKASANMWWIIIGAVIALVLMIILMLMFTGKTKPLEAGLGNCENKGGTCLGSAADVPSNCNTICKTGKEGKELSYGGSLFECSPKSCCCLGG